ncbi:hypothetical protein RB595_008081 [Gaeumannomyces hyphopodioides]
MRLEAAAVLALAALGWTAPQGSSCAQLEGRVGDDLHCRHNIHQTRPADDAAPATRRILLDGTDGRLVMVASPAQTRFADAVRPRVRSDNQGTSERRIEELIDDEWTRLSPDERGKWTKDSSKPVDNHESQQPGVGGGSDSTKTTTTTSPSSSDSTGTATTTTSEESSTVTSSVETTTTTSSSESTTTTSSDESQSSTTSRSTTSLSSRRKTKATASTTIKSSWTSKTKISSTYNPTRTSTRKIHTSFSNHTISTTSSRTKVTTTLSSASRTTATTARTRKSRTTTTRTLDPTRTRTRTLAPIFSTRPATSYTNPWPRPTQVADPYNDDDEEEDEYYLHHETYEDWEFVAPPLAPSRTGNPGTGNYGPEPSKVANHGGAADWEAIIKSSSPPIPTNLPMKYGSQRPVGDSELRGSGDSWWQAAPPGVNIPTRVGVASPWPAPASGTKNRGGNNRPNGEAIQPPTSPELQTQQKVPTYGPSRTSSQWQAAHSFPNKLDQGSESESRRVGKSGSFGNDMVDFGAPGRERTEIPDSTPGTKFPWSMPKDTPPSQEFPLEDKYNSGPSHQGRPSPDLPTGKFAQENAPTEQWTNRKPGAGMQASWHLPVGRPAQGVAVDGRPDPNRKSGAGAPHAMPAQDPKDEALRLDGQPKWSQSAEPESQSSSRKQKNSGAPNAPAGSLPIILTQGTKTQPKVLDFLLGLGPAPTQNTGDSGLRSNAFPITDQHPDRHGPEKSPGKISVDQHDRVDSTSEPGSGQKKQGPWELPDLTGDKKRPQNINRPAKPYPATPGVSPVPTPAVAANRQPGEKTSEKDQEEWHVFVHPATGRKIYTGGGDSPKEKGAQPRGGQTTDAVTRPGRPAHPGGEARTEKPDSWRRSERQSRDRRRSRSRGELMGQS